MADNTKIEWTDATWNPITGCSVVSAGCTNCYAMRLAGGRLRNHPSRARLTRVTGGKAVWTGEVRFNEQWLDTPLRWRRPRMIFVCAHGDLFHENVPDEWIDRVFAVMALAPRHTFQVLTKRPERARAYLTSDAVIERNGVRIGPGSSPRLWPHVWLGVSVEDQATADERIPILLDTPAAVRWISAEPLLGPVDLSAFQPFCQRPIPSEVGREMRSMFPGGLPNTYANAQLTRNHLDWVVAGGESGPRARPSHPDWFRSLRDQCAAASVPFLFKQWGEWAPGECGDGPPTRTESVATWFDGRWLFDSMTPTQSAQTHFDDAPDMYRLGKKRAGRTLDGVVHDEYPRH